MAMGWGTPRPSSQSMLLPGPLALRHEALVGSPTLVPPQLWGHSYMGGQATRSL